MYFPALFAPAIASGPASKIFIGGVVVLGGVLWSSKIHSDGKPWIDHAGLWAGIAAGFCQQAWWAFKEWFDKRRSEIDSGALPEGIGTEAVPLFLPAAMSFLGTGTV
jgi:hypothetical protein